MIVNRLAEFRNRAKLSQDALAERIGSSRQKIRRLEVGETDILHEDIPKIAAVYGVPWYALLLPEATVSSIAAATYATTGMSDSAAPFKPPADHRLASAPLAGHEAYWRVKGNHLDAVGIIDGAIVILDMSAKAVEQVSTGDVIVAQVYGPGLTNAISVTRQFVGPEQLITNSRTHDSPILHMSKLDISIKGVVRDVWSAHSKR